MTACRANRRVGPTEPRAPKARPQGCPLPASAALAPCPPSCGESCAAPADPSLLLAPDVAHPAALLIAELRIDRESRAAALDAVAERAHAAGIINDDLLGAYRIAAGELRAGCPLRDLRPSVARWQSPAELARTLGIDGERLEAMVRDAGIDGHDSDCVRTVIDPFRPDVGVEQQYSPEAADRLRRHLDREDT